MTSIGSSPHAVKHSSAVLNILDPRVDNDAALAHANTLKPTDTKGSSGGKEKGNGSFNKPVGVGKPGTDGMTRLDGCGAEGHGRA